jgi:hypothetical protein
VTSETEPSAEKIRAKCGKNPQSLQILKKLHRFEHHHQRQFFARQMAAEEFREAKNRHRWYGR